MRKLLIALVLVAVPATAAVSSAAARRAARPTLSTSTHVVSFGQTLTLKGAAPGVRRGEKIQIFTRACGFTGPVPIGTARARAGGAYSFTFQPQLNATYLVQAGNARSRSTRIDVSPDVQLRRVNGHTFAVDVSVGAGQFFTSKVAVQELAGKRWRTVAKGVLQANSDPGAATAVSTATLKLHVKRGTRLRAEMSQAALGACYRPAKSPELTA